MTLSDQQRTGPSGSNRRNPPASSTTLDASINVDLCPVCRTKPAIHARSCSVCQQDVGFPNVRAAARGREREALALRMAASLTHAAGNNCQAELRQLREIAGRSRAVFNRHLGSLQTWLLADNPLFLNFYSQIRAGREPKDEAWENQRPTVENAVSPHYFRDLSIAALSPDGRGMDYYGPYTVVLRDELIAHRATCFEENPFYFCRRDVYTPGEDVPPGYRAVWPERADLAVAKLGSRVLGGMSEDDLAGMMLERRGRHADCDFIEVHIYGPVHRNAIRSVSGPVPKAVADRAIWRQVKSVLLAAGVEVEEHP